MNHDKPSGLYGLSYWVVPGKFLAGCYPAAHFSRGTGAENLTALLTDGIRHFVNLMEIDSIDPTYEAYLHKLGSSMGVETGYCAMPIRNYSIPTEDEMRTILDVIDENMAADRPVYVHCYGGLGRTGTVVGCWLARHGTVGAAALERIAQLRLHTDNLAMASPETEQQVKMVMLWKPGD